MTKFFKEMRMKYTSRLNIYFFVLFAVTLGYCLFSGSQIHWPDEFDYVELAKNMVADHGYVNHDLQPTAIRPPGYPFIVAAVFYFHESVLLVKLLNVLAFVAAGWVLSLIVKDTNKDGQVLVPILFITYPLFIFTVNVLVPQIVGGFLFVFILYLLFKYKGSIKHGILGGLLAGVLILTIPTFLLILLGLLLLLTTKLWKNDYGVKFAAIFLLSMCLVVVPWVLRSSLVFNKFVFISTNAGINLLYGNSENAEYDSGLVDISKYMAKTQGLNEAESDAYYKKSAVEWVKNNPEDAAILYFKKVLNNFNFKNKSSTNVENRFLINAMMFIAYYPLLLLVCIRTALRKRYEFTRDELLLYILYFGSAFVGAIVYSRIRYRIPFDFLLIAMVAIFMGHLKNDIVFNWHMSKILRVPAAWWSSRAFFMIKVNK